MKPRIHKKRDRWVLTFMNRYGFVQEMPMVSQPVALRFLETLINLGEVI